MRHHFDHHLNVKDLILTYGSRHLVELGALEGHNTLQFLKLREEYPFHLVTISDGTIEDAFGEVRELDGQRDFKWVQGKSYDELKKFPDRWIDFCSIDTEHTSECLTKELDALLPKLFPQCIVVFHDTNSFPELRDVILDFVKQNPPFAVIRETIESAGAMAIGRNLPIGFFE